MPYMRTGRPVRVVRRSSTPGFRAGSRLIWTYETISHSPAGTVPVQDELTSTLNALLGVTDRRGYTWMGCHYQLTAVPTVASTRDTLVLAFVRAQFTSTPAQTDPSVIATRSQLDIAGLVCWSTPYSAAPVAGTMAIEATIRGRVKAKRLLRSAQETMFLAWGSQAAAQTWHVDGIVSNLWKVR